MVGTVAAKRLILRTASRLATHQVGIRAAESRRARRLVRVHHDVVLGSLLDDVQIVVVHRLRVVMVAAGYDVAHIARLHGIVAIFVHQLVGLLDVPLVVLCRAAGFVVHQQLHTLLVGIVVQHLDVEVGVWRHEVEHVALPHVSPVFPAYVPAFHQHLVQPVLGGEVDIPLHILVVSLVRAVGLHLRPVYLVQLDARQVVGVVPVAAPYYHLPPYATVFRGVNPAGVLQLARLVQVQYQVRRQHIAGVVAHHHRAPGCLTGCLHTPLQSRSIRRQMAHEGIISNLRPLTSNL